MNWLAPLKRAMGGEVRDAATYSRDDMRRIISEGADQILRYRRNPMMPEMHYGGPIRGVAVIRDEVNLEMFLMGIVAASTNNRGWQQHKFYYPCIDVGRIQNTSPWRALVNGTARHNIKPLLTHEKDMWVFEGLDWLLCEVQLCLA